MEGPSLFLAVEQLQPFRGKKILRVSGNTKIGKERLKGKKVLDIFSWGKHLIFQFEDFALKTHFLLYGSFEATVKKESITGDYKRSRAPRLTMSFSNGEMKMFNCSVKFIEDPEVKKSYDFTTDVLAPEWDENGAIKKMTDNKEEEIGDVLLDQEIFSGVGNIIKNEVLFLTSVNPKQLIKSISKKKQKEITHEAQTFSKQFYEWRKIFQLKAHLQIYRKSVCPICGTKIVREKTGKRKRWSYYCPVHQPLTLIKQKKKS